MIKAHFFSFKIEIFHMTYIIPSQYLIITYLRLVKIVSCHYQRSSFNSFMYWCKNDHISHTDSNSSSLKNRFDTYFQSCSSNVFWASKTKGKKFDITVREIAVLCQAQNLNIKCSKISFSDIGLFCGHVWLVSPPCYDFDISSAVI